MYHETVIKTPSGIAIGKLVESDGKIVAQTMSGIALAQYDKASNRTMDMSGRQLAQGNVVASYLYTAP